MRVYLIVAAMLTAVAGAAPLRAQTSAGDGSRIDALERAITADPENLKIAADYRQLMIAAGTFDRSIDFFEKLAKKDAGPNLQISLALAYLDKAPPSGDLRRLSLGRAAISAATRSIESRPSVLAYFVRGWTSLYFNRRLFRRVSSGIADLERARTMLPPDYPAAAEVHIYTALGDGYWEDDKRNKAREVWRAGAAKFPANRDLQARIGADDAEAARIVKRALDPSTRVDTSLRELYPD
jgi:tetratricopeptide (TPR) repeat protein